MYGTSDRIEHRTIQRKSPSSEENLYVRKKTRKVSEENCIGYSSALITQESITYSTLIHGVHPESEMRFDCYTSWNW